MATGAKVTKPKPRASYGIPTGVYRGEIFCYIESIGNTHCFLSLPKMEVREVPEDKFEFGIANNIIEYIDELPKDVFTVVRAQYLKNRSNVKNASN